MPHIRSWPPVDEPLTLRTLVDSPSSFVLLLPVAPAACEGSDEEAVAAERNARRIINNNISCRANSANTVVRWGMVSEGQSQCQYGHVAVLLQSRQSHQLSVQAADVFRRLCEGDNIDDVLHTRETSFRLDELRALLSEFLEGRQSANASASISSSKGSSRLALSHGFDRLRLCHGLDSTTMGIDIDAELDSEEATDMGAIRPAMEVEMEEHGNESNTCVLKPSPSLSLPMLPSLPPAPLVSPGTTSVLKRKRSLRILDFDTLEVESTLISKSGVDAESRAATAAISKIRDYLYLGGKASASLPLYALQERRIVAIVNLAAGVMPNNHIVNGNRNRNSKGNGNGNINYGRHDGIEYTRVYARDAENEDSLALVPVVTRAVRRARERGGAALIHCHRGVSRSATLAIAVLMMEEGDYGNNNEMRDLSWALREVRTARPVISPNVGFVRDLQKLDKILRGKHEEKRITRLARLKDDPGDGEECLVEYEGNLEDNHVWNAIVVFCDQEMTVARGALVHERKWREAMRQAKWIEDRNRNIGTSSGSLKTVALDEKVIAELRRTDLGII